MLYVSPEGVYYMKTILTFFAIILFTNPSFSQSSAEVTCRAQAKEVAVQTYASCITQARASQVDDIRKSYQKELADLKQKYDSELKKVSGNQKSAKSSAVKAKAPRATKGVAKELPTKEAAVIDATPVQTVSEGTKVVAVAPEESSQSVEKEAQAADQIEIIDIPAE